MFEAARRNTVAHLLAEGPVSGTAALPEAPACELSFVVWCDSGTATAVTTVLDIVPVAEAHPEWDVQLVLVAPDEDALRPLLDSLDGDLVVVLTPTDDRATAFAAGGARATGRRTVHVRAGDPLDETAWQAAPPERSRTGAASTAGLERRLAEICATGLRPWTSTAAPPAVAPVATAVPTASLSIVLISSDDAVDLARCLVSVAEAQDTTVTDAEFVIVDDASTDGTRDLLAGLEGEVTVVFNHARVGDVACLDRAIACSSGDHVLVLPVGARVSGGWLDDLARLLPPAPGERSAGVWSLDSRGALVQREEWDAPAS